MPNGDLENLPLTQWPCLPPWAKLKLEQPSQKERHLASQNRGGGTRGMRHVKSLNGKSLTSLRGVVGWIPLLRFKVSTLELVKREGISSVYGCNAERNAE